MLKISERDLRAGRRMALDNGCDIIHALGCTECNLKDEFLFALALLGWDEEGFLREYFTHLMGGRRG